MTVGYLLKHDIILRERTRIFLEYDFDAFVVNFYILMTCVVRLCYERGGPGILPTNQWMKMVNGNGTETTVKFIAKEMHRIHKVMRRRYKCIGDRQSVKVLFQNIRCMKNGMGMQRESSMFRFCRNRQVDVLALSETMSERR